MNKSYNTKTCKEERSALQGLNLINSFLFGASTEKPEDAEFIAKLIIERATGKRVEKISVTPEKSLLGIDIGNHGIRMDLYIEEYENGQMARVYDIEPNNYGVKELPMRSRYSQALTDVKLLEAGQKYCKLPEYISIWILPEDPFGQNRMLYIVKNSVEGFPRVVYNDGVKKLFLYTGGELGGSEELKNLLHYFSKSDEENVVDSELSRLHDIVENARGNWKVGEQYMTLQDYIDCEIRERLEKGMQQGIQQGIQQGMRQGISTLVKSLRDFRIPDEKILEKIMQEYNMTEEEAKTYLN